MKKEKESVCLKLPTKDMPVREQAFIQACLEIEAKFERNTPKQHRRLR